MQSDKEGNSSLLAITAFSLLLLCILTSAAIVPANTNGGSNGAPIITLNSPLNNSVIINGTLIDLSVTADYGLAQAWYSLNGGENTSLPSPFDIDTSSWVNGTTNLVDVWANDTIGNTSHELYLFKTILDIHEGDLVIGTGEIYHILKDFDQRGNITVEQGGLLIFESMFLGLNNTGMGEIFIRVNGSMNVIDTGISVEVGDGKIELIGDATVEFVDSQTSDVDVYCGLPNGLNDTPTLILIDSTILQLYSYDYANIEMHNASTILTDAATFHNNSQVIVENAEQEFMFYFHENSTGTMQNSTMREVYIYNFSEVILNGCSLTQYSVLFSNSSVIVENMNSGSIIMEDDSEALIVNSTIDVQVTSAKNITIKDSSFVGVESAVSHGLHVEWLWCDHSSVNLTDLNYATLINDHSMMGVIMHEYFNSFMVNATLEANTQVDIEWPGPSDSEPIEIAVLNTTSPSLDDFSPFDRYIYVSSSEIINSSEIRIYYTAEEISSLGLDEDRLRMFYYNGTEWVLCNNTDVNNVSHYVWANETELGYYYCISCFLTVTNLTDPSTGVDYSDSCTIGTYLKDIDENPLEGKTVHFEYMDGGWNYLGSDTTDSGGYASYTFDCTIVPGTYPLRVRFDGQPFVYSASSKTGTLTVNKENVTFSNFDPYIVVYTDPHILSVDIRDHDNYSNYQNLDGSVLFDLYDSTGTSIIKSLGSGTISSGAATISWKIDVLPNDYKVRVYYAGNTYYNLSEQFFDLTVNKEDTSFYNYSPSTMTYDDTVTISVDLRDADNASHYENLDGETIYFELYDSTGTTFIKDLGSDVLASGTASIMWAVDETAGNYVIKISWDGNSYYNSLEYGFSVTIYGRPTELSDPSTSGTYSDYCTFTTRLTDNESNPLSGELVYFEYNDSGWIALGSDTTNASGYASITIVINLKPGNWSIRARFDGNPYYESSIQTGTLNVAKETTELSDPSTSIEYGDTATISTTLTDDEGSPLSGLLVSFELNVSGGWQGIGTDITDGSGVASIQYAALELPTTYFLRVSFVGDNYYLADTYPNGILTINKEQTQLTDPSTSGFYGENVTVEAYLTDNDPNPVEGMTVIFDYYDGSWILLGSNTTNSSGYASILVLLSISEGNYTLRVRFDGDSYYSASSTFGSLLVGKKTTQLSDPSGQVEYTDYVVMEVQLEDDDLNPLDSKQVGFYYWNGDWELIGTDLTNSSGWASYGFTCTLPPGSYEIRAWFTGDSNYTSSFYNGTLTVFKESTLLSDPSLSAPYSDSVTISTILTDGDSLTYLITGRTVIFEYYDDIFGWTFLGTGTVSTDVNGKAELNFTIDEFRPGQWTIRVTFEGDSYFNSTSRTGILTVVKETTDITIVSMPDTITGGSAFTVVISVADDEGNAVGNIRVRLYVDGVLRKEEYTNDDGQAQFTLNLPQGNYTIRFSGEGNDYYQSSEFSDTIEVGSGLGIFGQPLFYIAIAVSIAAIAIVAYLYKMKIFPFKRTYQLIRVQNPYIKQALKIKRGA